MNVYMYMYVLYMYIYPTYLIYAILPQFFNPKHMLPHFSSHWVRNSLNDSLMEFVSTNVFVPVTEHVAPFSGTLSLYSY